MKLGVISQNLEQFAFEDGLRYARDKGFQAVEVGACGLWGRGYCDTRAAARRPGRDPALVGHLRPLRPRDQRARGARRTAAAGQTDRRDLFARVSPDLRADGACRHQAHHLAGRSARRGRGRHRPQLGDVRRVAVPARHAGLAVGAAPASVLAGAWQDRRRSRRDAVLRDARRRHDPQPGDAAAAAHEEIGPVVACNFDISHLWYQGIDPVDALYYLGPLVQHVHAKDILINRHNARVRGMMDSTSTEQSAERSWTYTLAGWGHDEATWREFVTTLRLTGYDHVISLEMESEYFEVEEGLDKSVAFLKPLILEKPPGAKWWEIAGMERAGGLGETRSGD